MSVSLIEGRGAPAADVPPSAHATAFNQNFRPQNFGQLKRALGEEYRDLEPTEWLDQLDASADAFQS